MSELAPEPNPAPEVTTPESAALEPEPMATGPAVPRVPWVTRAELAFGGEVVGVLLVVGILCGLLWRAWARTPTRGLAYYHNTILPDETEGFISTDGRFVVLTAIIGLAAGFIVWSRRHRRGPVAVTALAIGTVAGAWLTDLMGHLVGGGSTAGKLGTQLPRLPLEVHATGLLLVEGMLALLVYLLCTMFTTPDDLGFGDPVAPERDGLADATAAPAV